MASTESPDDAFYVLKQGSMHGPFTRAELHARFTEGALAMEDFVQVEGVPIWQPLARILGNEDTIPHGAIAPDWRSLLTWVWLRLRFDLDHKSVVTGWVCLSIGLLSLALSHWTFIFWLPWILAALLAALALCQRRRMVAGALLLAAALGLPLVFFAMEPKPKPAPDIVEEKIVVARPVVVEAPRPPAEPAPVILESVKIAAVQAPPATPTPKPEPAGVAEPTPAPPAAPASEPAGPSPVAKVMNAIGSLFNSDPAPAGASADSVAKPAATVTGGDFVQHHRNALVVVKDRASSGSGFVAKAGPQTWLFTNIHVAAGMTQPQFTRIDGTQLKPGVAEAAVGHDAMRIVLAEPPTEALEIMTALDATAKIGDDVLVLGNSGGGGVITSLPGKIVGIGPDRIEVSAEFIPGNSGSPIIHAATGKVIGIATYLTRRYEAFANAEPNAGATPAQDAPGAMVVRRFGFRLDSVKQWQPLNWSAFQGEARIIEQISAVTGDVFDFLDALKKNRPPRFATAVLRRPAENWMTTITRPHVSQADREQATRSFLTSLRSLVQADVSAAQGRLRYAYFQDELRLEREVRDRLYKAFNDQATNMSTPQMGRAR